ncbi:MAG: glycosyltransferase [Acidobacteria bacterium]|nr:MAG: glycosyltransferase [Acidobacteriota bacterium]REK04384.1 MAG: glycosyltransferase [Acidobacteriota bacterium]
MTALVSTLSPGNEPRSASPTQRAATTLRVGHLIKSLGRGGAEGLLAPQIRAGRELGHSCAVAYFLPWKDALVAEIAASGAPVQCLGARSSLGLLLRAGRVRRWIRASGLDLLHCHLPLAGVAGRLAARGLGVPLVYTEHNLQPRYRRATRALSRTTWGLQDQVVAVSEEVAASIRQHLGDRVPVQVVLNGIDVERFAAATASAELRAELGLEEGAPVIGAACVFRRQKRLDLWLEAAAHIHRRRPQTRFLLVGDGPLLSEVEATARQLGLESALRLPGLQPDITGHLALMDVFLISSDFEGLPLALLEAMAAGVPVVATAAGGIPQVLRGDLAESLCPLGDADALAARVLERLDHPERSAVLASLGQQRVRADHSVERMTTELDQIYRRLVAA